MSDVEQDEFYDATELVSMDLETSMKEVVIAIDLFLNNKFEESRQLLKRHATSSMYHALGLATIDLIQCLLSFDPVSIEKATTSLNDCVNLTSEKRFKKKILKNNSISEYSEEQVHAELCYAECLLLKTMLLLIEDESIASFIKAVLNVSSCYSSYKECREIERNFSWKSDFVKSNFTCGVKMGLGMFNLMLSLLPKRFIQLLGFFGFSASRDVGFNELMEGASLKGTTRFALCNISLVNFHLYVTPNATYKIGNNQLCEKILDQMTSLYPNSFLFLLLQGRLNFMNGKFDESKSLYKQSWQSQKEWRQFHHICFWELTWVSLVSLDYSNCLTWCSYLVEESKWSPTIYNYLKAVLMIRLDKKVEDINQVMEKVPLFKKKIAGKSLPTEKFVIKRSEQYFKQNHKLFFADIELIYMYNMFKILASSTDLIQTILIKIEEELGLNLEVNPMSLDNKCLGIFLKAVCLSNLKYKLQAEECFQKVISSEKNLKYNVYLVPFSYLELALMEYQDGNRSRAANYLDIIKNKYDKQLEGKLHYRMHSLRVDLNSNK